VEDLDDVVSEIERRASGPDGSAPNPLRRTLTGPGSAGLLQPLEPVPGLFYLVAVRIVPDIVLQNPLQHLDEVVPPQVIATFIQTFIWRSWSSEISMAALAFHPGINGRFGPASPAPPECCRHDPRGRGQEPERRLEQRISRATRGVLRISS
jgi:hypothetical protein